MNQTFLAATPVLEKIEKAGFEAYFVGGAVRDYLLNREIHDVDIATSATPHEIKNIFPSTVDVGIEHGTILVLFKGQGFEVTTFRSESNYEDFRRPASVTFIRSLEEDLRRRDFTMNAIAMDREGRLIDPFNGKNAIDYQIIETVGEASERFKEDALRVMRAIRFVSQLGFSLDRNTEREMANSAHLLKHISIERITAEMTKLLSGTYREKALSIAIETNLYSYWPSLFNQKNILQSILSFPTKQLTEIEIWILCTFLFNHSNSNELLKGWKLPSKKIQFILRALFYLRWRREHEWTSYDYYRAGKDISMIVERVYQTSLCNDISAIEENIENIFKQLPISSRGDLKITGEVLLEWVNKPAGPWVKDVFESIEKAVINNDILNEVAEIKRWVTSCYLQ
ncbi:CCA tRNA nucleotidyltransferase [Lederbergia wuyishanensis]|uniref:CCA-adding enzyme n=1 Tax=Lederbergia wuyishanensis TaxID=1347903 RepID=A0ABU0D0W2_9BACI|nr:CCA tRNA nucleotidyltransferase [Lederbergia wuyishanensis]MCJ8006656.1 CCA tRNA nucleotidyltransferase [Lederbergia wuyishanensis]MDQ0342038.1 tRNA nucleotidyltransferase (CCA-adding enzyme) [Lederbergia wuyishanensis]